MTKEEVIERITSRFSVGSSSMTEITRIELDWDKLATFLSELTEGKIVIK